MVFVLSVKKQTCMQRTMQRRINCLACLLPRNQFGFATKRYLDFNKLPINTCNKLFDTLFLPILLYGSEIWGAYDNMNFKKWENDPVERQHTQFYKHFLGLNRRAPNVVARNETGRLPLKLNILLRIIKFWIHLESLPENSIAKQCLIISNQLAMKQNLLSC